MPEAGSPDRSSIATEGSRRPLDQTAPSAASGCLPRSVVARAVALSAMPQATKVLAAEPSPCSLQMHAGRVGGRLVIRVLSIIAPAVSVDQPAEGVLIWRSGREAAGP